MKRYISAILATLMTVMILIMPPMRMALSMAVMGVYSALNSYDSLLADEDINIDMPGGLATKETDWYPFVMTFNADEGFSSFLEKPSARLTIMYNFPTFSSLNGCSRLFDSSSPYYSSFYGAYTVKTGDDEPFGFIDNGGDLKLDLKSTAVVPKYDFQKLVLNEFGLDANNEVFEWEVVDFIDNVEYAGEEGFSRADAKLKVNGCAHKPQGFTQSYLQYGIPSFKADKPLEAVDMYGRVYGKYLSEKQVSVFFYILCADKEALEKCDEQILSKSRLIY